MELNDIFNNGYNKLPHKLTRSYYWKYVLSTNDKVLLPALWDSVLIDDYFYASGLLVANIRHDTIMINKIGSMSHATIRRSLNHLNNIGAIVKINGAKFRNNKYFLGFRRKNGQDRIYLMYHLLMRFEEMVKENIDNQLSSILSKEYTNIWTAPKITNYNPYCLRVDYRKFILNNIDNHNVLLYGRVSDKGSLFCTLFNCKDMYQKPLPHRNYSEAK